MYFKFPQELERRGAYFKVTVARRLTRLEVVRTGTGIATGSAFTGKFKLHSMMSPEFSVTGSCHWQCASVRNDSDLKVSTGSRQLEQHGPEQVLRALRQVPLAWQRS